MSAISKSLKVQAFYLMFWQLLVIIALSMILLLIQGIQNAFSALLGGLSYWLPTLLFAWRIFTHANVRAVRQFAIAFFVGEMIKLFLSAFLFLFIAKHLPVNMLSMLIGFVGAIIAFWVVCGVSFTRVNGAAKQ